MSGRGMTPADVPSLVHLTRRLRQETHGCNEWDEAGVTKYVTEMRTWNFATVVEQILRRGTDPDARTPAALVHKVSSAVLPSEKVTQGGPPKQRDECPKHIGQPRPPFCAPCNTDNLGPEPDRLEGVHDAASARAALGLKPKADA